MEALKTLARWLRKAEPAPEAPKPIAKADGMAALGDWLAKAKKKKIKKTDDDTPNAPAPISGGAARSMPSVTPMSKSMDQLAAWNARQTK